MIHNKYYSLLSFLVGLHSMGFTLHAQALADSIPSRPLKEVEVKSSVVPSSYKTSSPTQILRMDTPEKLNALSVSDAVKHFSGVQVKDYGGVGGLKTVSIRSLGANHTNVIYDGISISDYQSGQTDLGRFSLDNIEMITLNTGESDNIFQTAQSQSLAGALNIITQSFTPDTGKKRKIKASLKAGSFGLIHPALLYSEALNNTFSVNASVDYLKTAGNYPFKQTIGFVNSTTEDKKRENSDVETLKLEANLAGRFNNRGKLVFKNYYYVSDRGLPGPAFYYKDDSSGERLNDRNFFSQVRYIQPVSEKIDFQANAKFNYSFIDYINPNREMESVYYQREYYLNATFLYRFSEQLSFSWANDGAYGNFNSNQTDLLPSRTSWLSALSGKYETASFDITAKILNTFVDDEVRNGNTTLKSNHLSPYIGFSVHPFQTIPVRLRGFYKNTFRMPTFGDVYYSPVPIVGLRPESARQYDLGLTFVSAFGKSVPYISFSGDAYWNEIHNKIVAMPTANMFIWTVTNYGKVAVKGLDLNATVHIQTGEKYLWQVSGAYTYQDALNKTKPRTELQAENYNKRMVYTARHSASATVGLITPWIDFNYNLLYCGKRYATPANLPESQMKPFAEQGVSLMRTFDWKNTRLTFTAECLNIFDVQYEVVRSYPMAGRSFRFGIKLIY
ncbi:MAG: TonB-dependent receptor plug domain-containing protein [Candidatus Symbiothrix sp.]|jgi:outer membrane cobalamin receptor|nr:TonB-dependent receptor plug domain-containing protein [Candidatus Symbiothrix sp.]